MILLRCDGTPATGLGHVSRCLGLAEALAEIGVPALFLGCFSEGARNMLTQAGIPYEEGPAAGTAGDRSHTLDVARRAAARAIVLDSYAIDAEDAAALHARVPVVLIDDFCRLQRYECAAVLNFTVGASRLPYPGAGPRLLLGPEYLLVRRALRRLRLVPVTERREPARILVAMGGSDPLGLSLWVAEQLARLAPDSQVRVVVGVDFNFRAELQGRLDRLPAGGSVDTQQPDLSDAFAWATACICAGGLTKYEAAYLGIPAGVLSQNADQAMETRDFAARGLCWDLGLHQRETTNGPAHDALARFLADDVLRKRLGVSARAAFPDDPTGHAAKALADAAT